VDAARARDATVALDPASLEAVVEGAIPPGAGGTTGSVRVTADEAERVALTVDAGGPGLAVLSDQHAPGWTATLDGRPAPVHRVNLLARGVFVTGGRHELVFRYRTPGLAAGSWLALGFLVALAAWGALRRRPAPDGG
jgi:hypothetical protein